ncbi:MAG: type I restriction enzyme endonuclease domain-containing protein [Candidatus Nanopelagicales bacterium]
MTGSATDPEDLQPHIRNKAQMRAFKARAKTPTTRWRWSSSGTCGSPDSTPRRCTTMYVDKPMRGASLMQAITRVNRTFKDKPAGLIVDYIGIAEDLKDALADYTKRDQDNDQVGAGHRRQRPSRRCSRNTTSCATSCTASTGGTCWPAVGTKAFLHAAHGLCGVPARPRHTEDALKGCGRAPRERPLPTKQRFVAHTQRLRSFFTLVPATPEATRIRDDVAFFDAVRAAIAKIENAGRGATTRPRNSTPPSDRSCRRT